MYSSESEIWQKRHESRINVEKMRVLRRMSATLMYNLLIRVRRESHFSEDLVTKVEKDILRWFRLVKTMSERRLQKKIYKVKPN